ncbi:MAG: response regulator, partial [Myxococcales bacterium]|nr:response regulator [Myxococcales bacterium]
DVEVGRFSEPAREDDDGDRLLVSLHDVSERKRSADALRALEERERAAERLRALGELAAGVAHNFNNSLTSILAHAQVLARRAGLPGEVRADLQVIERVAQGAAVTVRRIQSFARARDPEAREFCDFGDVVGNAVALTRPRWQPPDGGRWTLKYVHAADRPLPILGNAAELCEVVVNLILNGLDAMVDGGAMRVETGVEDDRVWVEVSDQGVGIDIDSQRRLFDPFFSTKGSRGLGLGLSVSHGIIRRHGGEISVFSAPGQGSTFTIWLPRAQGATTEETGELGDDGSALMARPSTVLVVDDDDAVLASVETMLGELGHTVVVARDGREALSILDGRRDIELVLTDLAMPVLDGSGLLRELERRWPSMPTALMTGMAIDADSRAAKRAKLVLRKPLELARVERALAQLLPLAG